MIEKSERNGFEIAIIGMSGRFPGARNVHEFWENLENGVNSIHFFTREELLEKPNIDPEEVNAPNYVRATGIIDDVEYFDAFFFGYTPLEAEVLDPQTRLFYEVCWEALEDAGCDPSTFKGAIGVYGGGSSNLPWQVLTRISGKDKAIGSFSAGMLSIKDYISSHIAHTLDLKGPAVSMHTACSTSLVAIDLACRGLLTGQCHAALAGAMFVSPGTAKGGGYVYEKGIFYSQDGYVRAFDAKAKGVVFSHGGGAVLLKRLDDAIAAGDHIYAVIKGFAVNNDGTAKSSFSAPSVDGQARCIRAALYMAEVEPESISYIEAHGTGTELGDPIEVEALKLAFTSPTGTPYSKKHSCAIGSLKTNIGHLDTAAGAASIIKVALMMKHRQIPPSLNYESPNPKIDFKNSPFFVNTQLQEWKNNDYPLRAGISSFGVGGTNAHLVVEEPPEPQPSWQSRSYQLILLSARTANALEQTTRNLINYLKETPRVCLPDAAYTLAAGRKAFEHKRMLVCRDVKEALGILEATDNESSWSDTGQRQQHVQTHYEKEKKRAIFMFPGQGSQYVDMARGIYETEPLFRKEMDRCFESLKPLMDYDPKEILYPGDSPPDNSPLERGAPQGRGVSKPATCNLHLSPDINQTSIAQPLIFASEYALAKLLMAWGITPYAMIGHSIGEYTAACLAGVFSLEDALFIVAWRGKLMQQMPEGGMLSVPLPEHQLKTLLNNHGELDLAAVNGPSQCVVSGPHEAIAAFSRHLEETGHQYRKLHTSHAFHSKMMDPILKTFAEKVARVRRNTPTIPFISNVTGQWITLQDAADPAYWAGHLRSQVRFADGAALLLKEKHSLFIEVGPGRTLNTFIRQHPAKTPEHQLVHLVRHPKEEVSDEYYLINKIGQIWLYGQPSDWNAFYAGERRHRLQMPTYPFQRKPYWIKGNPTAMIREGIHGRFVPGKRANITDWFYIPSWKPAIISPGSEKEFSGKVPHRWLVLVGDNNNDFTSQLVNRLKENTDKNNETLTVVKMGEEFANRENDYEKLIRTFHDAGGIPDRIVHLLKLAGEENNNEIKNLSMERVEKSLEHGFYSLLYLARALGKQDFSHEIHITLLTAGMQEVWDRKVMYPEKALVMGPLMVIPLEYPDIKCRCIDIMLPPGNPADSNNQPLINQLLKELRGGINDPGTVVAYRGNYRFVRSYEPVPLQQSKSLAPRLKEGGIYLITGGLGGIGLALARHLARTVKIKLILTGRSVFPAREEWEDWLDTHPSLDSTSRKIRSVKELEALGADVRVYSVDVADQQGMRHVVEDVREQWGTINGVIHSAGVPGGGVIQLKTRETAEKVLAPKVKGTLALNDALQALPYPPDFILLCSSMGSVVPSIGQVDYFSANAFLDAFAFYKNTVDKNPTFTISVNWDAWQQVGMAVEAAKQSAGIQPGQRFEPHPLDHPLFDHYSIEAKSVGAGAAAQEIYTYTTYFSINRHWVLDEHRSKERNGIVPGVTYLEMAYAALKNQLGKEKQNSTIEIRDVSFLTPLMMKEGEERETRMTLRPQDETDVYEFWVRSRIAPGENKWESHARGEAAIVPGSPGEPRQYDLKAIEMKCNREEIDAASTRELGAEGGLLIFGPRWQSMKTVKIGSSENLAFMELPHEFHDDLQHFTLHPSLLDTATSFFTGNITKSPYIPYSYKKLRVYRAFPGRIYAYRRLVENNDGKANTDFLGFNITIMDEEGRELADIEEFTLLEISDEILARLKARQQGEILQQVSVDPEEVSTEPGSGYDELVKDGISPLEGVEAFDRILGEDLPRVVVSTRDLEYLIQASQAANIIDETAGLQETGAAGDLHERPDISVPYLAPTNDVEQKMANIWQELLGVQQVGINDDFFELGGDSLKAASLIAKIKQQFNADISVRKIFNYPSISGLANQLGVSPEIMEAAGHAAVKPLEKRRYYAVSPMQKRLYVLNRINGIGTAYNLPMVVTIEEKLDIRRLEQTFQLLIHRHESLRTSFHMKEEEPVQIIHEPETVDFHVEILDHRHKQDREKEIEELAREFIRPFDLTAAPLMRVGVVKLPGKKSLLIFDVHHIAVDGTSYMIILKDFVTLAGDEGELPRLKIQYKDFSGWLNSEPGTTVIKKQEAYWLDEFREDIPVLNLPTDYPRPAVQVFNGSVVNFTITQQETNRLKALALEENATLFMVLLGIFYVFLARLSSQEDIVVGTPAAGRRQADIQEIVGMFVNTLALRNYPAGQKNFSYFLEEIKEHTLEALDNQDYPFEILVEKVPVKRDASRNPLFDVMFDFQGQLEKWAIPIGYPVETNIGAAKFDITFTIIEEKEYLACHFEYCTRLFKKETMERYARYFKKILSTSLENPDAILSGIDILSQEERKQLVLNFNDTAAEYPQDKTIQELFAEQVEQKPDHIAVVGAHKLHELHRERTRGLAPLSKHTAVTYKELNSKSNQLARLLLEKGLQTDAMVGLMVGRSVEMVIGVMGILQAGGAYLPIDPDYPEERINYMLSDSTTTVLVTAWDSLKEIKFEKEIIYLSDPINRVPTPPHLHQSPWVNAPVTSLAYNIYTSGSTGSPRGVMIEHGQVINLVYGLRERIYRHYAGNLHVGLVSPYIFDASVKQIFAALLLGYALYIAAEEVRLDSARLMKFYRTNQIDISDGTPAHLRLMLESGENHQENFPGHLLIGGEGLTPKLVEEFRQCYGSTTASVPRITNVYGPTECCVDSTLYEIPGDTPDPEETGKTGIFHPIGKPMPNQQIYIVSAQKQLQPIGVPGELCISGGNVGRGYLNLPELTSEKFCLQRPGGRFLKKMPHWPSRKNFLLFPSTHLPHSPYLTYSTIYQTGDLCRWLLDGNIEFLGRIDQQVKIRGFRIEAGEIENQLSGHPSIKETIVTAKENEKGERYLCAYIVVYHENEISVSDLRDYLSTRLPTYMIPSYFVFLEQIPLTSRGKINRKALPDPGFTPRQEYVAPRNETEEKLVEVWSQVLGLERIGIADNFFEIGGDSIKAVQISARLRKYQLSLSINDMFLNPKIENLSTAVKTIAAPVKIGEEELITGDTWHSRVSIEDVEEFETDIADID